MNNISRCTSVGYKITAETNWSPQGYQYPCKNTPIKFVVNLVALSLSLLKEKNTLTFYIYGGEVSEGETTTIWGCRNNQTRKLCRTNLSKVDNGAWSFLKSTKNLLHKVSTNFTFFIIGQLLVHVFLLSEVLLSEVLLSAFTSYVLLIDYSFFGSFSFKELNKNL